MNKTYLMIVLGLLGALLLSGCLSTARVGALQTESESVEVGDAESVRVEINFGAGNLDMTGGAEELLEADFTYNVARLKPEVEYKNDTLVVQQPETEGLPVLQGISDFRNEWDLRLNNAVPMDLSVNIGAGTSELQLSSLSLTGLDVSLGAGISTVDLSGDWVHDLDVTIDSGASNLTVRLPSQVGVRVEVESGPVMVVASSLTKEGNVYTNSAYGVSEVTLQINMKTGIGQINLEVNEQPQPQLQAQPQTQTQAALQALLDQQVKKQGILGMVMAVRLPDGTVTWSTSGYTDPSGNERWSADTGSLIASVTKTFTAVVVMQLVEEEKLSLDDTVDTWFPDQPNGDEITVRMLLSHTSGLPNYQDTFGNDLDKWSTDWTPEELIAEANKAGTVGKPGDGLAHYSNTNYVMLGLIIERVTGNRWDYEVESRIIKPLGLKNTTFLNEGNWKEQVVPCYIKTSEGFQSILEHPFYSQVSASNAFADGGIASTASDLMTFSSALFDGKLVSRETLTVMTQPVGIDGARVWSLGGGVMKVDGQKAFGMAGDNACYHTFFVGTLDGKFIVTALVNTDGDVISPSMDALQEYVSP